MGVVYEYSCPRCGDIFGHSLAAFNSGLGAPRLECRKCGTLIDSSREEWSAFSAGQKAWYLGVTFFYAYFLGVAGQPISRTIGWAIGDLKKLNAELPMSEFWKWSGMAAVGASVLLYQAARVVLSMLRTSREGPNTVRKTRYFSFGHNGHYWWIGLMMGLIAGTFIAVHLMGLPKA